MITKAQKLIICGKAASGKTYLVNELCKYGGIKKAISFTTRPKRESEIHGRDYYFTDDETFDQSISDGHFIEWQEFNGWKYGTLLKDWNDSNLFIMTPSGIKDVYKYEKERGISSSLFIVYLDISMDIRYDRLHKRNNSAISMDIRYGRLHQRNDSADSVIRRIAADERDFEKFLGFTDYRITDSTFDVEATAQALLEHVNIY